MKRNCVDTERAVMSLLRGYGFSVKKMPEMKKRTCDIIAQDEKDDYLIEVKGRLERKEPGPYELKSGYSSSVNKKIEEAVEQLEGMRASESAYRVIWFVMPDEDEGELLFHSVVDTLYGIQRLELGRGVVCIEADCFFADLCPMVKFPVLTAVIVQTRKGLVFCLNSFSPLYEAFKATQLFRLQKRLDGLIDPVALEKSGCCLHADIAGPRAQWRQKLFKKYKFERSARIVKRTICDSMSVRVPPWRKKSEAAS